MKSKLIVADDHSLFLEGLCNILQEETTYEVIAKMRDGQSVINYLQHNVEKVDLVITDISMPGVDGISLTSWIKKKHPALKVLVVSMHHDERMIYTLVKNGVEGYVPKGVQKKELIKAISTILGGERFFSEKIREIYQKSLSRISPEVEVQLSKREREVIKLIAAEYTTQEIADKLFLSYHTVESYRKNLLAKLDVRNLAGLTKYAIKLGLVDDL
ncbi:MAG: response regulator [Thermonemataceae bacterium]